MRRPDSRETRAWVQKLAVAGLLVLAATACNGGGAAEKEKQSMSGSELPIVRPFALDRADESLSIDANIPPRKEGQGELVMIGFRVAIPSGNFAMHDKLETARIPVLVTVTRDSSTGPEPVPVFSRRYVAGQGLLEIPVRADGYSDEKSAMVNADAGALSSAGLLVAGQNYAEYAFVTFKPPAPGRYRISVQIKEASPDLTDLASELLISYTHTGE